MIVLDSDYDALFTEVQPWPRELWHHGDLELLFGRPFDGYTGHEVVYICRTCSQSGAVVARSGDPEQLAFIASALLALKPCA